MREPWLIQRCKLQADKLSYDYMGSTEFEIGDQAKSLQRIFAAGINSKSIMIEIGGKSLPVYIIAGTQFPETEYAPILQRLAENKLHTKEWTEFNLAAQEGAGVLKVKRLLSGVNVWFDFENDVLWTLSKENQKSAVSILDRIRNKWSETE